MKTRTFNRRFAWILCLILGVSLLLDVAQAATFTLPDPEPGSYEEIRAVIEEDIPDFLDGAMCGGWNTNETIGSSAADGSLNINSSDELTLIPFVEGAPGRRGIWDGDPEHAMAVRDDTFIYPGGATGLTTVCDPETTEVTRPVWVDPVIETHYPPPDDDGDNAGPDTPLNDGMGRADDGSTPEKSDDSYDPGDGPAKPKDPGDDPTDPNDPGNDPTDPNDGSKPGSTKPKPITVVVSPGHYEDVPVDNPYFQDNPPCLWREDGLIDGPWTPGKCQDFCWWINEFTYQDCRDFEDVKDDDGKVLAKKCAIDGWQPKYTCSEAWVNPRDEEAFPNCRECTGEECRCPRSDDPGTLACPFVPKVIKALSPLPVAGREKREYASFYRKYHVTVQRNALEDIPGDLLADFEADTACYAYYDEFDPKDELTDGRYQCVIAFPHRAEDLAESQAGKGEHTAGTDAQPPVIRTDAFDAGNDTWYPNLGGGMSFVNEQVFRTYYGKDLSSVFLDLDTATIEATYQHTEDEPEAPGGSIRPPDETGRQTFTRWWNRFLADAAVIISPPTLRLRIAPALAPMLSALPVEPGTARWIRSDRVEAQLKAREDMLDTISDALRRFLLLRPEPVPVVVPVAPTASSVEESKAVFLAYAQRWQDYKEQRLVLGQPPAPGANEMILKLQEYAAQIDRYRSLRSELPGYLSQLLTRQREILLGIHEWNLDSVARYRAYISSRNARLALAGNVRDLQTLHATFRDKTTLPWCHMEQFTTPIYSLLDPWLPNRPGLDGGEQECESEDGLPVLCLPDDQDLILDLTNFRMDPGGTVVPVADVLFLRLDIMLPPPAEDPPLSLQALALPALPAVPTFSAEILDLIPIVDVRSTPDGVPAPPPFDETDTLEKFERARTILENMNDRYDRFWKAADKNEHTDALECESWNTDQCAYSENELIQIFTRLASRPFELTQSDFDLLSVRENEPCDPADEACLRMRSERHMPKDGWQIVAPSDNTEGENRLIDGLRSGMRDQVIGPDGQMRGDADGIPYYRIPANTLYPLFQKTPSGKLSPNPPPSE